MRSDLLEYHRSIAKELESVKNRVRNLIGSAHWLSDGEHKEAVLRRVLRSHIPETIRVGNGFVYFEDNDCSSQQDIMLTDKSKPTLFKDEELVIVTPEAVKGVIEVKTRIASPSQLNEILDKLSGNIQRIRGSLQDQYYSAGLFVYEPPEFPEEYILHSLQQASKLDKSRAVDLVSFGPHTFVWFDRNAHQWVLYRLMDLSHSYFISHLVWRMTEDNPRSMRFAWFPLKQDKARHGLYRMSLKGGDVQPYYE